MSVDLLGLLALATLNLTDVVLVNCPFLALKIAINIRVRLRLGLCLMLLLLLLLEMLQCRLDLQPLLQIVVCRIFQATVADEVVELVACLYDVQIQDVVKANDVLFLQNANVSIYVQVFQQLLPHIEANNADDVPQSLLEHSALSIVLIRSIKSALDYD